MQRFFETRRDAFGNPASGLSCSVYLSGTSLGTLATLFNANDTTDTASTGIANPIITGADGIVSFAVADGDYDMVFVGADGATETRYRQNFFDSSTATTIPVSQISLTMPSSIAAVTGSPGTSISVTLTTQAANLFWAGPTSGAAATPTFRAPVAADVSSIACLLTTNQTVAGNKTFSGSAIFTSTVGVTGAAAFGSTVTVTGNTIWDKAAKFQIDTASPAYPWRTQALQFTAMAGSTAPSATTAFRASGVYLYNFAATAINSVMLWGEFPYDYEAGTDFYLYAVWSSAGTDNKNAQHGWEYSASKAFSQVAASTVSTVTVVTAAPGTQYMPVTTFTTLISGTNLEPGSIIAARFYREGNHANDTLTDNTNLHFLGILYRASRWGTKNTIPPFFT